MISLLKNRPSRGSAIPSRVTTLGISWLNNEFKAVAVERGVVQATWERPGPTDDAALFETYVREAAGQTGYRGQTVSLVLAHPRLVQQMVELPPVKGAALQKLLQRQAQQQRLFPGEAAWVSQNSLSSKGVQRLILHLFPRVLLNQMIQGCRRNGLHLVSVVPASAVLQRQLSELPLEKDDVALLTAKTGESTSVVVGRASGRVLLARTLPGTWSQDTARLGVDLNRTVLFVSQQLGVSVKAVCVFGPGAEEHIQELEAPLAVPVNLSPARFDAFYWATEALKLRPEIEPNLISRTLQKAPQRRAYAKSIALITGLVLLASVGLSTFAVLQSQQEAANQALFGRQAARLEAKRRQLEALDLEMTRKQRVIELVVGQRAVPVPAWFLGYLSEAVPSDLVVTNLDIRREQDNWRVRLAGTVQQGMKQPVAVPISQSIARLKEELCGPPFSMTLVETTRAEEPRAGSAGDGGVSGWVTRLASGMAANSVPDKNSQAQSFAFEGVMK